MDLEFYTADVFTDTVFHGAQIAVFPDARGLELAKMQLIAQELNLPQTVFVFPALEDAGRRRIRIFSPLAEAEFGGHGIIAAAFVLASIGAITLAQPHTPVVIEQKRGPVEVHITRDPSGPRRGPSRSSCSFPRKPSIRSTDSCRPKTSCPPSSRWRLRISGRANTPPSSCRVDIRISLYR